MSVLPACDSPTTVPDRNIPDYNVVLISIDTLRADHLGVYGYDKNTSPNIDALAEDSVLFKQSIAHGPSTLISHASIFTSQIPAHHGASIAANIPVPKGLPVMAELLQEAGLSTVSFNDGGQLSAVYGLGRGFDLYNSDSARVSRFSEKTSSAIEWLDNQTEKNFFLFLHTYETHTPFVPREEYLKMFDGDYAGRLPDILEDKLLRKISRGDVQTNERDLEYIINSYNAEIRSADEALGQFLEYLKATGRYDNTLIILTSDHGEELGERGYVGRHGHTLHDEVLHVPLIIKLPGSRLAGAQVDEQVRGIDILPTLLDLLNIDGVGDFAGRSLVPLMKGERIEPLVAVSQIDTTDELPPLAIRTESHKLIIYPENPLVGSAPYRDFTGLVEFTWDSTALTLSLSSPAEDSEVKVLVDDQGKGIAGAYQTHAEKLTSQVVDKVFLLGNPSKQMLAGQASRQIFIQAQAPCDRDENPDCPRFRIHNPSRFYILNTDPDEHQNHYFDKAVAEKLAQMRLRLADHLSRSSVENTESIKLDETTRRKLRSLGYL